MSFKIKFDVLEQRCERGLIFNIPVLDPHQFIRFDGWLGVIIQIREKEDTGGKSSRKIDTETLKQGLLWEGQQDILVTERAVRTFCS